MSNELINISGVDKAELLAALYNASKQQGMGFCHKRGAGGMSVEEAQKEIDDRVRYWVDKKDITVQQALDEFGCAFDYLHGRVMKVDIGGDELDPRLYDRDNGQGAAFAAIAHLLA